MFGSNHQSPFVILISAALGYQFSQHYYPNYTNTFTLAYDPSLSTLSNPVRINYPPRNANLSIRVWGICNGLICISPADGDDVVLWNPATKEFKEVPTVPIESGNEFSYCNYAFGYDDEISDFKVASFVGFEDKSFCEVQVYTLKSNTWRRLENKPLMLCQLELDKAQLSVSGARHWLALSGSFNFKDDRFDEMPLPRFCIQDINNINLCTLGGSLCLQSSTGDRIDVWVMKEYGVTESWAKLFSINQPTFFQLVPLQLVNNGEVLFGYDNDVDYRLDLYDLKSETSINLKACAMRNSYYARTFVYVESLVTLNSGIYVGLPEIDDAKASAKTIDLYSINSGSHVAGIESGDSEDRDDSKEEQEEEEIAEGFPSRPKSVYEAMETSPQKSCEILDRYNCYVEQYMDLKRRKVDLETRRLDFEIRAQEDQHMSMDISKMHPIQLKWWQMRANEIAEKRRVCDMSIGDTNGDKEENEDCNHVEQEVDMDDRKKKSKMMHRVSDMSVGDFNDDKEEDESCNNIRDGVAREEDNKTYRQFSHQVIVM